MMKTIKNININNLIKIFLIGYFFTMVVSINTIFIVNKTYLMAFFGSFTFNILWSLGVINVSKANKVEVVVYSISCALGCVTGMFLSGHIYDFVKNML